MKGLRVLIAGLLLLACARAAELGKEAAWQLHPFASDPVYVDAAASVGPYLYTSLRSERTNLDFLTPQSESCLRVLRPESRVTYRKFGSFGRIQDDEDSCDPIGVASLAAWRDRRPRARHKGPLPRATARFSVIHRDQEAVLARGRFPLANLIQIPSAFDLVALIPNVPDCERPLELGEASLVFRPVGPNPYRLLVAEGECPILGFAQPPPASEER